MVDRHSHDLNTDDFSFSAALMMALTKRKRYESEDEESSISSSLEHNEDDVDISSALTTKKIKTTQSEDDEDDLADFIRSSIAKRSMKEGTKIVKKSKGKDKMAKGEVGGGSFQSMGGFKINLRLEIFFEILLYCRFTPIPPPLPYSPRLQTPHSNPTPLHPSSPRQPPTRSRRYGKNRFRQISRLPRSARSSSWWKALVHFWSEVFDPGAYERTCGADFESGEGACERVLERGREWAGTCRRQGR